MPGRSNHAAKNRWDKLCKRDARLLSDDVRYAASVGGDKGQVPALGERRRRTRVADVC